MAEVYLRRLSRWQAEQQRNAVADVYVGAYRRAGAAEAGLPDRQDFLHRLEQDVQHTGFDMVVADSAGTIGCAYGFRVPSAGEGRPDFRGAVPADVEEHTASGRTFLLAELMVLPGHRRLGVATRLVERLLVRLETELIVATTNGVPADGSAAETFRAWGWTRYGVPATEPRLGAGPGTGDGPDGATRAVWIRRPLR